MPGEKIIGVIHTGKGITIHNTECELLENLKSNPERLIDLAWDEEYSSQDTYTARLEAVLSNNTGGLAAFAGSIASSESNIVNLKITNRSLDFFDVEVDLEVRSVDHLNDVISALRANTKVHNVMKAKG